MPAHRKHIVLPIIVGLAFALAPFAHAEYRIIDDCFSHFAKPKHSFHRVATLAALMDVAEDAVAIEIREESEEGLIQRVAQRKGVRALELCRIMLTAGELDAVLAMQDLEYLGLWAIRSKMKPEDLSNLRSLKKLKYLGLNGNEDLADGIFESIAALPELEVLSLATCSAAGPKGLTALGSCPKLRALDAGFMKHSPGGLKAICSLGTLTFLDLSYVHGVSDDDLAALANLKSLERLELTDTVGPKAVQAIAKLSKLKLLRLQADGTTDEMLAPLLALRELEWLDLAFNMKLTDAFMSKLSALKALKVLRLEGTELTDAGVKALAGLRLIELDLGSCFSLTSACIDSLIQMTSLQALNLSWNDNISGSAIAPLAKLPDLKRLGLNYCKSVKRADARALADAREDVEVCTNGLK